jgi:peroxiredoxin family protein
MGLDVSMYFTFYGLKRLKAGGLEQGPVSEPDVTGAGKTQMLERMGAENMAPIGQLLEAYRDLGGKVYACEATLAAVGLTKGDLNQEWIDGFAGVVQLIEEMKASSSTLFI